MLSTFHSGKGLKWAVFHVHALFDGNFPACPSAGNERERRREFWLLYVAMTRARQRLFLHSVRYYHRPKGMDDALP